MPLIIILAECGIELIPKHIRNHSAIRNNLTPQNFSSQLLDNALHHSAMKNLKNFEKRGRPDITHICLLNILGSSLNKSGNLKLYIHTINNKIFELNPKIRIAKNYNRFKGLMAKLLIDGVIKSETITLINPFKGSLNNLLRTFENPEVLILSRKGKPIENYNELFLKNLKKNYIVIIGGFQKSTFSKEIMNLSENLISISKYPLEAWVVTYKIISFYEIINRIE
jgi:rRNA small subunit pseudouridine methyltransferase Nep1